MKKLVVVQIFNNRTEAEIVKNFLATKNISAVVQADDAGGMRPFPFQYEYDVKLLVPKENLEKAKKLLAGK